MLSLKKQGLIYYPRTVIDNCLAIRYYILNKVRIRIMF